MKEKEDLVQNQEEQIDYLNVLKKNQDDFEE